MWTNTHITFLFVYWRCSNRSLTSTAYLHHRLWVVVERIPVCINQATKNTHFHLNHWRSKSIMQSLSVSFTLNYFQVCIVIAHWIQCHTLGLYDFYLLVVFAWPCMIILVEYQFYLYFCHKYPGQTYISSRKTRFYFTLLRVKNI